MLLKHFTFDFIVTISIFIRAIPWQHFTGLCKN